jgi:Core-2/I-Branching enzyme
MRVAFLVLNHRQPEQLMRLLGTLRSQLPDSSIVVHHDAFHGDILEALVEPFGDVHLLRSGRRIFWGDSSITDVCCWAMEWMREHLEFDWMVLLSAQDYPIKPLASLADDLVRGGADAVFMASPVSQISNKFERISMHHRYLYQYRPAEADQLGRRSHGVRGFLRRRTRSLVAVLNVAQPLFKLYRLPDGMPYRLGWRARNTPFSGSWPCWKGSQWFALSRSALEYVLTYLSDHPEYVDYYRRTMVPDESMLATIVFNSPHLRVANRDVTYTRWSSRQSGHPDIFQVADLPELMAVPQYFARKFDIYRDSCILDALDLRIRQDVRPVGHS